MGAGHSHDVKVEGYEKPLWIALILTASFMVAEVVGGILTNSLALISDAAHMFTDSAALAISLLAIQIGKKAADKKRTFGYHRFEILAAAFNALLLFAVAFYILYEAYQRLQAPAEIQSTGMLVIAVLGLLVNLISMRLLSAGSGESLNVKGAYLEVWSDMLGSIGVIIAAVVIMLTGWGWVDSVVAAAIGIAYGAAALFQVSFALGAFFAGMVMRESDLSHRAAEESLPLRDAFAVLFFVSVGMLFDPLVLIKEPLHVLAVVGIIVIGKTLAAAALVLAFRYPLNTALTVAASLAQIGEFSFILAGLGMTLGLLPQEGMSLVLAGALISIALNPALFALIKPLKELALRRSALARKLEHREDPLAVLPMSTEHKYLKGQVVVVGYGRVGRRITRSLAERNIPFVVVEQNRERVEQIRGQGLVAVTGDSAEPDTLIQAHIADAAMLVIATPDPMNVQRMVETARALNPNIDVVIRTHSPDAVEMFRKDGLGQVFFDEEELARGMKAHILSRLSPPAEAASKAH